MTSSPLHTYRRRLWTCSRKCAPTHFTRAEAPILGLYCNAIHLARFYSGKIGTGGARGENHRWWVEAEIEAWISQRIAALRVRCGDDRTPRLRRDGCRRRSVPRSSAGTSRLTPGASVRAAWWCSILNGRIRRTCCGCAGGDPGEVPPTCRCHLPRIVDSPIFVPDRGRSRRTVGVGGLGGLAWSCRPVDEAARATLPGRRLRRPKQ